MAKLKAQPKVEPAKCCRCNEDFPLATEPASWRMGELRRLSKAPKKVREPLVGSSTGAADEEYLCGNCYFDLTDEDY